MQCGRWHLHRPSVNALFLSAWLLAAGSGWTEHGVEDGVSVATRTEAGSEAEAVRARMTTRVPPAIQAEAIWGKPGWDGVANKKALRVLEVLDELPNKRVYYQVVSAPLISDRDYVLRIERVHE